MGYALYNTMYLAMFRQQTIFFDIYMYMIAIYERKAPAHGLKHTETSNEYFENIFLFWEKMFDNEEHEHY